jgi:hypothetical protein
MKRYLTRAALVLALAGCEPEWDLDPREDRLVRRWLLCEECVNGELDSVIALGSRGQAAMEHALRRGPTKERRNKMRRQAEAMYARIPSPAPVSRQRYVDHYLSNYVTIYSSRAIVALRRINTPSSHAALVRAMRPDGRYRYDVRRLLGESVGSLVSVVVGDSQHAPLDSFVRVNPTILVRDTTTGQVLSNVRVVFRVDSGGGSVGDSIRLTNPSGRANTRWRLGASDSVNVLRVTAAGRVIRLRAFGHPYGNRVVFFVQPRNATVGQPIPPPPKVAVQDAWGTTQSGFNQDVVVSVQGTSVQAAYTLVGGLGTISDLRVFNPGGFRLRAVVAGVPPALSDSFTVAPP